MRYDERKESEAFERGLNIGRLEAAKDLAAAEERGRRLGVEEAKQATRDAIEEWDGKHRVGNIYVVVWEALNNLAPRDSGKVET